MANYRSLTAAEIAALQASGSFSSDWSLIEVSDDFCTSQIQQSRLSGHVIVESGARVVASHVNNYHLGEGSLVDSVTRMECRKNSSFGNGVEVATINENGGRAVKIYDSMTAQCGYIMAIYRHREALISAMNSMVEGYAASKESDMGYLGKGSSVANTKIIREVRIMDSVCVDGASIIENATLCGGVKVGVDVKAYDFIAAEDAKIDNGAIIERCFVGECVIVSNGFTAIDSLIFASSHFENGEAASIFAGPYTVSHHKSSLLIAGIFSFFNAGSGSNQSNHLFKCGAVHQSAHLRGCKFSSSAYVMSPAQEGAFTTILGRHSTHHDTTNFPLSYLAERHGQSLLIPAMNLANYGTVRDLDKWVKRDKRKVKRDIVNLEEHNPYICQYIIKAIETLSALRTQSPYAEEYNYNSVTITRKALARALKLYNMALDVALWSMLDKGASHDAESQSSHWLDLSGQYISKESLEKILRGVESGNIFALGVIDDELQKFNAEYYNHACAWAYSALAHKLNHAPTQSDFEELKVRAQEAYNNLKELAEIDKLKDCSEEMAVSYGLDSDGFMDDVIADFKLVRGL